MTTTYLYEIPNATTGLDDSLVQTISAVPILIPFFLFFIFSIVFMGGTLLQRRRTGQADVPAWAVMGSIATLIVALPMTLTTGVINLEILGIIIVITIASGFWLFYDRNRNEI